MENTLAQMAESFKVNIDKCFDNDVDEHFEKNIKKGECLILERSDLYSYTIHIPKKEMCAHDIYSAAKNYITYSTKTGYIYNDILKNCGNNLEIKMFMYVGQYKIEKKVKSDNTILSTCIINVVDNNTDCKEVVIYTNEKPNAQLLDIYTKSQEMKNNFGLIPINSYVDGLRDEYSLTCKNGFFSKFNVFTVTKNNITSDSELIRYYKICHQLPQKQEWYLLIILNGSDPCVFTKTTYDKHDKLLYTTNCNILLH